MLILSPCASDVICVGSVHGHCSDLAVDKRSRCVCDAQWTGPVCSSVCSPCTATTCPNVYSVPQSKPLQLWYNCSGTQEILIRHLHASSAQPFGIHVDVPYVLADDYSIAQATCVDMSYGEQGGGRYLRISVSCLAKSGSCSVRMEIDYTCRTLCPVVCGKPSWLVLCFIICV